jgi:hypothetical protein
VTRPAVAHVTLRLEPAMYQLRSRRCWRVVGRALDLGGERFGMRVCHYSVQRTHLHLLVELRDGDALSRGMQGLGIRVARGLNRMMGRRGRVVADRYHARLLASPLEVRRALLYVLNNARRHAAQRGPDSLGALPAGWLDPFSSAATFDGWVSPCACPREGPPVWGLIWSRPQWAPPIETADIPRDGPDVAAPALLRHLARQPRSWLLARGWRERGLLAPGDVPGASG